MSETFSGAFLGERLADCLAQLGAANRSCVLLAYIEGCSHSEVAQRMNAPLGSVKSWIRRGLLSLRECLS